MQYLLRILLASLISLITLPCILALYDMNGPVTLITEKNFGEEVLLTEQVVLLEFYAPWCGHCKNLAPEYKKAAERLKGLVKVAAIDCNEQSNKNVCGTYGIKGFPTIKLFPSQVKKPKDYNGARTAKDIVNFALSEIPSFVQPISNKNPTKKSLTIEEFLTKDNETLSKVILFTNKEKTTSLYKALSVEFHNRLLLGQVKKQESLVIKEFNIEKFPTLIAISKQTNEITEFTGEINYENLGKFLSKYALPKKSHKTEKKEKKEKKEEPKIELEPYNPEIIDANSQTTLEKECLSRSGLCIFTFLPLEQEFEESIQEHESNIKILKTVKEKLHKELENSIYLRFLWFNSLENGSKKLVKDFKLSDVFPVLMILNPSRKVYRPYLGPFDEEGIERFVKDVVKGRGKSFEYDFDITLIEERKKDEL